MNPVLFTSLLMLFASLSLACGLEPEPTPEPSRTPEASPTQAPSPEPVASPTPASTPTPAPLPTTEPSKELSSVPESPAAETRVELSAPAAPAPRSYLTATVAPCTPVEGSDKDPCERRMEFDEHPFTPTYHVIRRNPPETLTEHATRSINSAADTPHMAIRAVALPGTSRCVPAGFIGLYTAIEAAGTELKFFDCYADFEVRDYVVGAGPDRLTIWVTHGPRDMLEQVNWDDEAYVEEHVVSKVVEQWEGYEWVLYLSPFEFATSEVWGHEGARAVQRLEDGSVAVVAPFVPIYEGAVARGDMDPEYMSRLITPLDVFEQDIRDAIATLGGVIAGEDPNRPSLVQDANSEFLHEFFVAQGVYDNPVLTPAPPPPAPGGDDPVGSGVPSNEGGTSGEGSAPGDPTPTAGN